MQIELHGDDLPAIEGDWKRLYEQDPGATPFSSFAWGEAWLRRWAPDAQPWILRASEGGSAVGLAAFVLCREGPLRVLRVVGEDPSDYWDVLAEPAKRHDVVEQMAALLLRRRGDWDVLMLAHLVPGTGTAEALEAGGLKVSGRRWEPYPGLPLPATFDEYLSSLPQRRRTNLRRRLRHLDEGDVVLHEVDDIATVPAAIDRWQELRRRQWAMLGKDLRTEHASTRLNNLMKDSLAQLIPAGQALMWEFWVGGRLAGSYVNFVDSRRFYQYLGGFDPEYARLGIGKVATGHGIRVSIDRRLTYYDFMLGAEPYKYWFGATDRRSPSFIVGSSAVRSQALRTGLSLRSALRRRRPGGAFG